VPEPKYQYIADDLRGKVESGELAPGSQLPTEIELMGQYKASRNTVRDAIKLLTTRGLVEPRPGQGTFVVEKINPFVSTLTSDARSGDESVYIAEVSKGGRRPDVSEPRVEIQRANRVIADALRLKPGDQVVSRHQQRLIDDIPWSLQTSFYPMSFVQKGATRLLEAASIEGGVVSYLANTLSIAQVGYRDSIAVRAPDENEIGFFRLPSDGRVQVFEIYRTGFARDGSRIRLTTTVYPADRNRFLVNVGRVPGTDKSAANAQTSNEALKGADAHPSG
jgi:GntR family transcriptional regulator